MQVIMEKKTSMEEKYKAEQFRKTKKNFFRRGHKIGITSNVEIFVSMRRKGRLYTFTNTENKPFPSQAEIVGDVLIRSHSILTL